MPFPHSQERKNASVCEKEECRIFLVVIVLCVFNMLSCYLNISELHKFVILSFSILEVDSKSLPSVFSQNSKYRLKVKALY